MFITFEGIEGSGKTTQIRRLKKALQERGIPCLITREPGGTRIGRQIRAVLLDEKNKKLTPWAELFLYLADRCQHVQEKVLPALAEGKWVICDRFWDATTVYQGMARGLNGKLLKHLRPKVLGTLWPDKTFLLDLPVETGLARAWARIQRSSNNQQETRFEKETLAFHEKIRRGYLFLSRQEPERIFVVDASRPAREVHRRIIEVLFH